ncbi:MAG TPA: AMP-binding protein [Opitutaceae bacterium]|nr:AMP-binding protein [Opitutaceae bacterium]
MERADLAALLGRHLSQSPPQDRVVCEDSVEGFQRAFSEAVAEGGTVFLADPRWTAAERAQFDALCRKRQDHAAAESGRGWLCIPTGGSTGQIKLARHDTHTLHAAITGFCRHFECGRVNVCGVLPLHHVSGLMAWLRTIVTGGSYQAGDWHEIQRGQRPTLDAQEPFLSLVPTQLQRLLGSASAEDWLRQFAAIFIGGGPVWPELLDAAQEAKLPISLSYGMTETAAMVTALRPSEFTRGHRSSGRALPHARVSLDADESVVIESESLFLGYYPGPAEKIRQWNPRDRGALDDEGYLTILGRTDDLIITGGEKVDPGVVEQVLRSTDAFSDVAVLGVHDPDWGQVVVACYPAQQPVPDWAHVQAVVKGQLAAFKRPKRYLPIDPWPRNEQGKLNRSRLLEQVSASGGMC